MAGIKLNHMKTYIWLIIVLLTTSCGTKHKVVDEKTRLTTSILDSLVINHNSTSITFDSIQRSFRREILQTITYMSPPDSTGTQYPQITEENRIIETFQENESKTSEGNDSTTINRHHQADITLDTDRKEDLRTDQRVLPLWTFNVLGIIVILCTLYGIYRLYKILLKRN